MSQPNQQPQTESKAPIEERIKKISEAFASRKMSFPQILEAQRMLDDGLLDLTMEEMGDLGTLGKDKIDGYKARINHIESRLSHFKKEKDEIDQIISTLNSKKKEITDMLLMFLKSDAPPVEEGEEDPGIERFGFRYKVQVVVTKANKLVPKRAPGPKDFINIGFGFVKKAYSWDAKAIKSDLKSKEPNKVLAELFTLEDSQSIKFYPLKGIDDERESEG